MCGKLSGRDGLSVLVARKERRARGRLPRLSTWCWKDGLELVELRKDGRVVITRLVGRN